jgi:RNA polymerase primary sigma factor
MQQINPSFLNVEEIRCYLKDIKKIPTTTNERLKEIIKQLNNPSITSRERDVLLNELVLGNLRFVISVAKQYQNQGLDLADLISEGNIGLMRAAREFDPTKKVRFISYAVWWVKQSIMSSLNDNARTIRIPSNVIQDYQKTKKIPLKEFSIKNSEDFEKQASHFIPYSVSLSGEINDEGDQLIDIIVNKDSLSPDAGFESEEDIKKQVRKALSVLNDKERQIVEKYFGLDGTQSNLEDLGEEFGCTKERIRQVKEKAMKKLRNESFTLLKYL